MKVKGNGSVRAVKNKKGQKVKNSWQLIVSLGNDPLTSKRARRLATSREPRQRRSARSVNSYVRSNTA